MNASQFEEHTFYELKSAYITDSEWQREHHTDNILSIVCGRTKYAQACLVFVGNTPCIALYSSLSVFDTTDRQHYMVRHNGRLYRLRGPDDNLYIVSKGRKTKVIKTRISACMYD